MDCCDFYLCFSVFFNVFLLLSFELFLSLFYHCLSCILDNSGQSFSVEIVFYEFVSLPVYTI